MSAVQLDFFHETTPETIRADEISHMKDSISNLRRGLFARQGDLAKGMVELTYDIDSLALRYDEIMARLERIESKLHG